MVPATLTRWSAAVALVSWWLGLIYWWILDPNAGSVWAPTETALLIAVPTAVLLAAITKPLWVMAWLASALSTLLAAGLGGGYNLLAFPELAAPAGLGA